MASFDALLLEPAGAKDAALSKGGPKIPLIAYPHGGPHSNMGQVCVYVCVCVCVCVCLRVRTCVCARARAPLVASLVAGRTQTWGPKPKTQNPKPKTQNPKPKTQNPNPQNPKPQNALGRSTTRLARCWCCRGTV
jgi:hypothetical protein